MPRSANRKWNLLRMVALSVLALAYLFASTRLAFPLKEWLAAQAASPVRAQAFPCAIHKCQCKNALQCGAHCCCFPKFSGTGSHGDRTDLLAAHLTACGGDDEGHEEPPSLSEHRLPAPETRPMGAVTVRRVPAVIPLPPAPDPEAALKVPILSFS